MDEYLKSNPDVISDLRKFLISLDNRPSKTVNTYVGAVKVFLRAHDVEAPANDWRKLKKRGFTPKRIMAETQDKKPSKAQLKKILNHLNIKGKTLVLFLASSGARIGETMQLKILDFDFCRFLVDWYKVMRDQLNADLDSWLFPRYHNFSGKFLLHSKKSLTIQWYDKMLQRLDPTMTSAMFRYGGAEKYLNLGYTPREVKEMGDWSNSQMPERYAERKGLTRAQREFADDVRVI